MPPMDARAAVAGAYRALGAAGMIVGSSGNVSARIEGGDGHLPYRRLA